MNLHFRKGRFRKGMSVTGWVLLYAWVYLLITIIFAEILTYRGRTSLNFMQLKHPMDWIILVAVLIASAGGVALLIGYKHRLSHTSGSGLGN